MHVGMSLAAPAPLAVALLAALAGGCGAKTSLPYELDAAPESRPEPGGVISITDPRGATRDYDLWPEELACSPAGEDAYRIRFSMNGFVALLRFLPYAGPGEYTSDNVVTQGDELGLPQCSGPCAEVDVSDGNTVVASSSNADCVVTADVDGLFLHAEVDCQGTPGSNGEGYVLDGEIDCVVGSGE